MINYSSKEVLKIMEELPRVTGYEEIDRKIIINEINAYINYLITDPEEIEKREKFVEFVKRTSITPEDLLNRFMSQYA